MKKHSVIPKVLQLDGITTGGDNFKRNHTNISSTAIEVGRANTTQGFYKAEY